MKLDIQQIKRLAAVLKKEGVEEFEWKDGASFIRMKRISVMQPMEQITEIQPRMQQETTSTDKNSAEETTGPAKGNQYIKSPIVGTFYRAPSPKAEPFTEENDKVSKGQVLCILEAMKLMNELEAEYPCEIVKILVENAEPVEYGEPLFEVKPL